MNVINTNFRNTKQSSMLRFHFIFFAAFFTGVCVLYSTSVFARTVETPYGPVEGMDFKQYADEEFAERAAEEYEGQEAEAGVVTDLVFTLTEENLRKKKVNTTFKQMFEHFCGPCHGEKGKGNGKNFASVLQPGPTDLTDADYMAELDAAHVAQVITGGSVSVEKSKLCPPWGKTFSEVRIKGLAAYVKLLSVAADEEGAADEVAGEGKAALSEEAKGGIAGFIIIWSILGLICGGIAVGAISVWRNN